MRPDGDGALRGKVGWGGGAVSGGRSQYAVRPRKGAPRTMAKQDVSTDTICAPKSLEGQVPALGTLNTGAERRILRFCLRCVTFHLWHHITIWLLVPYHTPRHAFTHTLTHTHTHTHTHTLERHVAHARPGQTHRDVGLFTPRLLGPSLATVDRDRVDWE